MRSLRARLGLSAALVVAAVVGLSTYLQARIVARAVEAEAVDSAAAIALGVSADLGEHTSTPSPEELVDGLAEMVRPSLVGSGIELSVDVPTGLPLLGIDRVQIEQALLNLLTNAVDAMPEGGRLELGARAEDGGVAIVVRDSGSGIAPEDLSRVFDPLFTTKPPGKGTGLGLPVLREIVEAHGGTERLESRPGNGTTAVVRLPRAQEG